LNLTSIVKAYLSYWLNMAQNTPQYQLFINPRPTYGFLQNIGYDWPYIQCFLTHQRYFLSCPKVDVPSAARPSQRTPPAGCTASANGGISNKCHESWGYKYIGLVITYVTVIYIYTCHMCVCSCINIGDLQPKAAL